MKRLAVAFLAVCLLTALSVKSTALAKNDKGGGDDGVSIFMTDKNSKTPKTFFALGETPYLYIGFPSSFANLWKTDGSLWKDPDGLIKGLTVDLKANLKNWYKLSNWDSVAKPGEWTVDASYAAVGWCVLKKGCEKMTFNYAPEPISSALFLLGGAAFGIGRIRKLRRNKV